MVRCYYMIIMLTPRCALERSFPLSWHRKFRLNDISVKVAPRPAPEARLEFIFDIISCAIAPVSEIAVFWIKETPGALQESESSEMSNTFS